MSENPNDSIGRKSLPHDPPVWIDPSKEIFFITICAADRSADPLLAHAPALLTSARENQNRANWHARIFLIMPDHIHALLHFRSDISMRETIRSWKRWTAKTLKIAWQDGFFDHRLRGDESADAKAKYIHENPVRAGLVAREEDWPHVYFGEAEGR